jgi:hypothetical protein
MSDHDDPFMEHPTGEFPDAVCAMESAIERLRALPTWDDWITICAQGQGGRADSYHVVELRLRGEQIDVAGKQIDLPAVFEEAGLDQNDLDVRVEPSGLLRVIGATPSQLASFLDGLFRAEFDIREFEDDGDYAVGAEW